jgi:hypothetical protein
MSRKRLESVAYCCIEVSRQCPLSERKRVGRSGKAPNLLIYMVPTVGLELTTY